MIRHRKPQPHSRKVKRKLRFLIQKRRPQKKELPRDEPSPDKHRP
jgi:hypothetical protein